MTEFPVFLSKIIEEGIEAARRDYAHRPDKLTGAINGFNACRVKSVEELKGVLDAAIQATQEAYMHKVNNYREIRIFEAEVDWVCNVVSAALYNQGLPVIIQPTAGGMMCAARILGVRAA